MQVVKKGIKLIIGLMGIVLFCACTNDVPVSVISTETPTPIEENMETIAPSVTEAITPTKEAVAPTKTELSTITPTETPVPTKTELSTITPTKTPIPTLTPTKKIDPTATKAPIKAPTITSGVSVTEAPSMELMLEDLISNGFQSMLDISQTCYVIFSECFNDSKVTKEETTLGICYMSTQEEKIQFQVLYSMQQTLSQVLEQVIEQGGSVLEENASNRSVSYQLEEENMIYRGLILEKEYKTELLGDGFGEEDSVVGTMQLVFAYPKELKEKYETDAFCYYVVQIP